MKDTETNANAIEQQEPQKLSEKYAHSLMIKLLIQNIPYVGSSLDTILSEQANKWRDKRLQTLLQNLGKKLTDIDIADKSLIDEMQKKVGTEDFYDLFLQACQKSALTHKTLKIDRFANILKNYLIESSSSEDYLIELFFNITEDLTEMEIEKVSALLNNKIEVYYSYRDKPFDIERLKNDVEEGKIRVDDATPEKYHFDNFYMYSFNRLEKMDLIEIETIRNTGGSFGVSCHSDGMSISSQLQYKRQDEIVISEFGKKYVKWILE